MPEIDRLVQQEIDRHLPGGPLPAFETIMKRARRRRLARAARTAGALSVLAAAVAVSVTVATRSPQVGLDGAGASAAPKPSGATTQCDYRPADPRQPARRVPPPPKDVDVPPRAVASMAFDDGTVGLVLDGAAAPCTTASITYLAHQGFYDGTACHRLTSAAYFVLQCGDPTGTGLGGPGYVFDSEHLSGARYPAGTLAMANAGPGMNGSQFFLVYRDSELPPEYTPFGRVTAGLDVLEGIAARGSDGSNGGFDGAPRTPVKIRAFTVAR